MIKKLTVILLLLISAFAYGSELEPFVSICIPDTATGVNWEKDHWKQVNFVNHKRVLKKIKNIPDTGCSWIEGGFKSDKELWDCTDRNSLFRECSEHVKQKPSGDSYGTVYPVCIKMNRKDDSRFMACYEMHYADDFGMFEGKGEKLGSAGKVKITCLHDEPYYKALSFAPDHSYIFSTNHSDIYSKERDSLSIEVGKCTDVTIE